MLSPETRKDLKQMLRALAKFSLNFAAGFVLAFLIFGAVRGVKALASEFEEAIKHRTPTAEVIKCRSR